MPLMKCTAENSLQGMAMLILPCMYNSDQLDRAILADNNYAKEIFLLSTIKKTDCHRSKMHTFFMKVWLVSSSKT